MVNRCGAYCVAVMSAVVAAGLLANAANAAVTATGDYSPADPSTWAEGTGVIIGITGEGALEVVDGTKRLGALKLGSTSTATGSAVFSGFSNPASLVGWVFVGDGGTGSITVQNQAQVSSANVTIGAQAGSKGSALVSGSGTLWNDVGNLTYVGGAGTGSLTIQDGAVVRSTVVSLGRSSGGNGTARVTTGNASAGTEYDSAGWRTFTLYAGDGGNGSLDISGGGIVYSLAGVVGKATESIGAVNVDGAGSKWLINKAFSNNGGITLGEYGKGDLNITNGGTVSAVSMTLANYGSGIGRLNVRGPGSSLTLGATDGTNGKLSIGGKGTGKMLVRSGGVVNSLTGSINAVGSMAHVDGTGSRWSVTNDLAIAPYGTGRLIVTNGGSVSAETVTNSSGGLIALDIGKGSSLVVGGGTGTLTNNGTLRLSAAATVSSGIYTPIDAGTITNGTVQAFGGSWNGDTHQFTVGSAVQGISGQTLVASSNRVLINIGGTVITLGLSFLPGTSAATVNARPLNKNEVGSFETMLSPDESFVRGWDIQVTREGETTIPAYVSMDIGRGFDLENLRVWHFDGTLWSLFTPDDLNYDGQFAYFTVPGFSGYAITAVPEPMSLGLFGIAMLGVAIRRRAR